MTRRILAAFLQQESNTFVAEPSSLRNFEAGGLLRGGAIGEAFAGTRTDWGALIEGAQARGWTLTTALHAHAQPSGRLAAEAFEHLCEAITGAWGQGHDGVLLMLHGAMVSDDFPDCEGELLGRLRALAGPATPIVATLDPHANVSHAMADHASALLAYRTTPHIDQAETTRRALAVLDQLFARPVRPRIFLGQPPTLQGLDAGRTIDPDGPMARLLGLCRAAEASPGVLTISAHAGFGYADVRDAGPSVAVASLTGEQAHADLAAELAAEIWRTRARRSVSFLSIAEGIARIGAARSKPGPLIIVDPADNPGSGAPGDETTLLAALLDADPPRCVFFAVADPAAVRACEQAGRGQVVTVDLGAAAAARRGSAPLRVTGHVEALSDGRYRRLGPYFTDTVATLGASVLLRVGQVGVIVTSEAIQTEERAQFRLFGLEVAALDILVCKGANHFRADLEAIASEIVFVDSGGVCSPDPRARAYLNLRRPIWPLDAEIFDG